MSLANGHGATTRQEISRGMVALMKTHVGRGPTTARAFINDDVITVLLEDTHTEVERTLAAAGNPDAVKELRQAYQDTLCEEAAELVREATSREVKAVMADHSVALDMTALCFVLVPPDEGSPPTGAPCDEIESSEVLS